jgi:hypothetical protein
MLAVLLEGIAESAFSWHSSKILIFPFCHNQAWNQTRKHQLEEAKE